VNRRSIIRWLTLGLAVTAVAATATVLPAFGAQDVVRLHFAPDGSSIAFTYNGTSQALIPTTRCEISSTSAAGPLMTLTSNRKLGINSNGIGAKTGGSQGTPCGRVDTTENIALAIPTTGVLTGRTMNKMTLDLELKGNAWVEVTLSRGGSQVGPVFGLQTGSSIQAGLTPLPGPPYMATSTSSQPVAACASPSDSGPDSGANDNCLWTINPGLEFDKAAFTVRVGEFSLEGSGDFGGNSAYDSLFYLSNRAPAASNDGYTTLEDTVLTVEAPGVLGNDSDGDLDPLTVAIAANVPVADGSVSLAPDGSFTYTPAVDFNGTTSFTYTASDGTSPSAPATVTIVVNPVNDATAVDNPGNQTGAEGDVVTLQIVATDVDGEPLTYSATGLPGGLEMSSTGLISGTINYTASSRSPYEVTVTVNDGSTSFTWIVADTMCSGDTVFDTDNDVSGYFTRLTDSEDCKQYEVLAVEADGTVKFQPQGEEGVTVFYRAFIDLGGKAAPVVGSPDGFTLFLGYDPLGGNNFTPVPWCQNMVFGSTVSSADIPLIGWLSSTVNAITLADIPVGESWCIAAAYTRDVDGELVTTWQLYGEDDPKFQ
jgi:hypothetical protein